MKNTLIKPKNIWTLIIALILIGSGIYVLFNPITALITSAIAAGILFVLMGISYMLEFKTSHSYMEMGIGLLDITIGLILLFYPGITAMMIPILFGLWTLFIGITQLVVSLKEKDEQQPFWSWLLGAGILGIIFGLFILFHPFFGAITVTLLMGTYLILYGVFEMNRYFKI